MRLDIHCADRVGIAQEILNILVSYNVDLKGIEVDSVNCRMYVSFPEIEFEQFQKKISKLIKIFVPKSILKVGHRYWARYLRFRGF